MTGRTRKPITTAIASRFLSQVDRSGECWLWTGKQDKDGYGVLYADRGDFRAHRIAYELANDVSPGDLFVCHRCDNPRCVRPEHLFLGTSQENTADRNAKGRQAHGDRTGARLYPHRVPRGERHGAARLTASDVKEIRSLSADGVLQAELMKKFGVSQGAISHIVTRKCWRHVE